MYIFVGGSWRVSADSTLNQLSGSGVNVMNPRYCTFEEAILPLNVATGTWTLDLATKAFGSKSLKLAYTTAAVDNFILLGDGTPNFSLQKNHKWIVSIYMKCTVANVNTLIFLTTTAGVNVGSVTLTNGATINSWVRVSAVLDLTASAVTEFYAIISLTNATICVINYDGLMIESQIGNLTTPSAYHEPPNFLTTFIGNLDATNSKVYRQATAPTGGVYTTNDLWFDTTSALSTLYQWSGSAWAVVATVGANSTNLNIGLGKNILANSGFALGTDHWTCNLTKLWSLAGYTLDGLQATAYSMVSTYALSNTVSLFSTDASSLPTVTAGLRYEASVYTGAHRCTVDMYIEFLNTAGTVLQTSVSTTTNASQAAGGTALTGYKQLSVLATAPATAVKARMTIRKSASTLWAATALVPTITYFIAALGTTNWNTVCGTTGITYVAGQLITCSVVGTGTGTAYSSSSYGFFCLPFFAVATAAQSDLSDWSEGMSGQIKQIDASNASTYIANAAIGTAYIANLAVTTGKIANLAVDTLQIAGHAVTVPIGAYNSTATYYTSWATSTTLLTIPYTFPTYGASILQLMAYVNCNDIYLGPQYYNNAAWQCYIAIFVDGVETGGRVRVGWISYETDLYGNFTGNSFTTSAAISAIYEGASDSTVAITLRLVVVGLGDAQVNVSFDYKSLILTHIRR